MRAYQDHKGGASALAAYVMTHTNFELYSDITTFRKTF
jgi:hypothetical protein